MKKSKVVEGFKFNEKVRYVGPDVSDGHGNKLTSGAICFVDAIPAASKVTVRSRHIVCLTVEESHVRKYVPKKVAK